MKLTSTLNGETREIDLRHDGDLLRAKIDGREYDLEISEPESDVYLLKHEGNIYEVFISLSNEKGGAVVAKIDSQELEIEIADPKKLRGLVSDGEKEPGLSEIKTAMPGKVVNVLKEIGVKVEKGEGIIVVEAMKMQNEMKAPKEGTITEIRFKVGETVNAGDVLVVIE